ncbi:MAG: sarcosine oxidase subunit gamma SoxG [Desulfobacterales bacterium]|nr:sarcosine oxidase subunit gamma SoxG [Desulfobacterales bacterium]
MTVEIKRRSPITFPGKPLKTEVREHWTVVQEYEDEDDGPWVFDLSHRIRLDLQDSDLANFQPAGIGIPDAPGNCVFQKGILINRMNQTQASIWHLVGAPPELPVDPAYTETTDATLFVALIGKNIFTVAEKLTALDFKDPAKTVPFLYQGPFSHVPCQIVTLERTSDSGAILLTCSRGYGRDMGHAVLAAGEEFGLRPAGENTFLRWIKALSA